MNLDNIKIGKYIREQRNKLGLSQQDLCEKVHVTRQAVSNWENGKTLPDSDVLLSLSNIFKVTINDILCAESMEQTVLELVDENNKKTSKMHRILWFYTSIIGVLLMIILMIYFISNYNSIKVYKVSSISDHFRIVDGIIISTSSNTYFKLGRVELKNNEQVSIQKVKMYYQKGKEKEVIFENNVEDRLYVDREGYQELYRKKFNEYKDHLYLEISYNNQETEIIKLDLKEDFSNDITMIFDESKIIKPQLTKEIQDKLDYAYQEEQISYEQKYQIRQELPVFNNELIQNNEPIQDNPVIIEQTVSKESISMKTVVEEPVIEEPIIPEEPPVEEQQIDYDEVISIIEEYGEDLGISKTLMYLDDNKNVIINLTRGMIIIESKYDNIRETMTLRKREEYMIMYQKDIEDVTIVKYKGNVVDLLETNLEIVQITNNYLSLIYQEKS